MGGSRHADATWPGKRLDTCCNIDSVTQQVTTANHHVANMHPNPELEAAHLGNISARLRKCVLRVHGTVNGIDSTGELGQDTIPSRVGYSSAIFSNQLVHDRAMSGQAPERSDLVLLHEPRIACNVSREDGHQPPFNPVLLPTHGALGAIQVRF